MNEFWVLLLAIFVWIALSALCDSGVGMTMVLGGSTPTRGLLEDDVADAEAGGG